MTCRDSLGTSRPDGPYVSWVVVQHGSAQPLFSLIRSVQCHAEMNRVRELLVIDNGNALAEEARDGIISADLPTRIIVNASSNYASGVNLGVSQSIDELVIVSNNDVELLPQSSLSGMAQSLLENSRAGVCAPQLVFPDGSWQQSVLPRGDSLVSLIGALLFVNTLRSMRARRRMRKGVNRPRFVGRAVGPFMMVKRSVFERMGGMSESYSYGEDIDFFHRMRLGNQRTLFMPDSVVLHVGAGARGIPSPRYALGLYQSHKRFYREALGSALGGAFMKLWLAGYAERALLWGFLGRLLDHEELRRRASLARSVLSAGKRIAR